MVAVQKIDSNSTGLRYALESSIGVLPGSPVWYPLEPNSYNEFGSDIKTVAREPINASRQNQKGVTVDFDASGGFAQDFVFTDDFLRVFNSFFFANVRDKQTVAAITLVDGTAEQYQKANAFGKYRIGSLAFATGFTNVANNGLKRVTSLLTVDDGITVAENLVQEAAPPAAADVRLVGHQFGVTEISITNSGSAYPFITGTAVAATGVLTFTGVVANNETVTIARGAVTQTYTFKTVLTPAANEVLIGADQDASLTNLTAAINGSAGSGTLYGAGTVANALVTGVADTGANTLTVTAIVAGTRGNDIATTEVIANATWGGATMTGGTGTSLLDLVIPGEWVFIGDSSNALFSFATVANNGWARVYSVTNTVITFDKTDGTWVTDAGTGKTIRVYFGRVLKNESDPALIVRQTLQLERDLGQSDDAVLLHQFEYLKGSVANQMTLNFKTADKITVDLSFVSTDTETRDNTLGAKSGTRPALVSADAFNTSSDFSRLRMAITSATIANPTSLFAFLSDFKVSIDNGATPAKAIGVAGAFEVTVGNFVISGDAEAYFSSVAAVTAVRANSDVTLDFALAKANKALVVDVPLIGLGGGKPKVEKDQPIKLPLTTAAGEHRTFHHTLLLSIFDYVPDNAF